MRGTVPRPKAPNDRLVVAEDFEWTRLGEHRKLREVYDIVHSVKLGSSFLRYPNHPRFLAGMRARGIDTFLDATYTSPKERQIHYNIDLDSRLRFSYVTVASNMGSRLIERYVEIADQHANSPGIVVSLGRREHRNGHDDEIENIYEARESLAKKGLYLAGIILDSDQMDRTSSLGEEIVRIVKAVRLPDHPGGEYDSTVTPREALEMGADMIAVGEPITTAENPLQAANDYINDMR